jgi:hypothetical protein
VAETGRRPATETDIPPDKIAAMQEAFREWYGRNYSFLEDGGTGDVYDLLLTLKAAC